MCPHQQQQSSALAPVGAFFAPTTYEALAMPGGWGGESRDTDLDVLPAKMGLSMYF